MNDHIFSLADDPQRYAIEVRIKDEYGLRQRDFEDMHTWFGTTLRGKYHIDWADLPLIIYSFSDEVDAIDFKLRFG